MRNRVRTCLTCQISLPEQYCYSVGVNERLNHLVLQTFPTSESVPLVKDVLKEIFEYSYFSESELAAGEMCRRCAIVIFKLHKLREEILENLKRRELKSLSLNSDAREVSNSFLVVEDKTKIHQPNAESSLEANCVYSNGNSVSGSNVRKRKLHHATQDQQKRRKREHSASENDQTSSIEVNNGFKCDVCNKRYRNAEILRRHVQVHSTANNPDDFRCSDCNRAFANLAAYQIHVVTHTRKSYACVECKKVFKLQKNFIQHQQSSRCAEKKFPCPTCGKMFKTRDKVKRHLISVHSDIKPFMCPTCGKGFRGASDLKLHEFSAHVCKTEKSHPCSVCGKTYKSSEALKAHQQYAHVLEKKHRCSTCGKGFALLATLRIHQVSHEKERPYMCTYCGRTYKYAYDLKSHEGTHHTEDEKRFECPVCNAKFHRKDLLRLHQSRENHCGPEEPAVSNAHEHRSNATLNANVTVAQADHHPLSSHHHVLTASHGFSLDSNSCFSIGSEGSGNLHIVAENSLTAIGNSNDNSVLDATTSTAPSLPTKEGSQLCTSQSAMSQSNYAFTNAMTGNDNISDLLTGMYDIT